MFGRGFVFFGAVCFLTIEGVNLARIRRQSVSGQGGNVIDNIFNIPITAIRQTAAAAQSFSPENSQTIDNVLQIPISTLEAVGNLVKTTSGQRAQSTEDLQRIRRERRDRILAQREQQRLQREQIQQQRLKQQQTKRTIKLPNKDPFGLNALSNLLVGNHGLFSVFGGHRGHGGHMILGGHGGHGGHMILGGHGGHGSHGIHNGHGGGVTNNNQHTYEVHENVEEDSTYAWHGITAGIGTVYGNRPVSSSFAIQNKIAPKEEKPYRRYDSSGIRNDIAPETNAKDELAYDDEPLLENKIAPRSNRISFQY